MEEIEIRMNVQIRNIEERDYSVLVNLFQEMANFEKVPDRMLNSVEQMLREKEFINGFVATNEKGEILGYVTYFFAYYTWVGKSLYMDDLYVRNEFRGKGIGTQLIQKIINFAKAEKCNRLRWQVSEWNAPAIEFYKSLGATVDPIESNCDILFR